MIPRLIVKEAAKSSCRADFSVVLGHNSNFWVQIVLCRAKIDLEKKQKLRFASKWVVKLFKNRYDAAGDLFVRFKCD